MAGAIDCKPADRSLSGGKHVLPVFDGGRGQRALFFLLVLAIALAFGGCALTHPTEPYSHGGMPGNAVLRGEPGGAGTGEGSLTLEAAIDAALSNNPGVAAARWYFKASVARRDLAVGERWPAIGLRADYTRSLERERVIAARREREPGAFSRDIMTGGVVLTAPLFTGGRIVNEARAAEHFREAAGHRLAWTRNELVYQVSDVFYAILAQERVIDSLDASGKALESHLEHTKALVAAEKVPPVDRMRIEVRLADIRQAVALEKHVMKTYCRALANFMGISNADTRFSLAGELDQDAGRAPPGLDEALSTAWRERKDYLAAKSDYEALARRVDAARAGYWPTLSVTGTYGGRWNVGSATGPGDESGEVGHAGIELYMPLFEGGRIDARVRERRAELAAARERLRELELHVIQDIEIALSNIHVSRERAAAVQKTMGLAHESLRIERQRHALGRVSALEVLDAQSALLESEITYYRALAGLHAAVARLGLAMGRYEKQ